MTVVEEYWEGVVDRLQAEVSILSRLIEHAGERGRENEQALQRILERCLPTIYGLGTGLVIDSEGRYSRQMDLVIFDQQHHPTWLGQTTTLLHPVETVYGVVEVKTTLRSRDIDDIGKKCRSIRELSIPEEDVFLGRSTGDSFEVVRGTSRHPLVIALAYASEMTAAAIEEKFKQFDPLEQPDLMCVLRLGLVAGKQATAGEVPTDAFEAFLTLLQLRGPNGERLGDLFVTPKTGRPPAEVPVDGRMYPTIAVKDGWACADPARAFVMFLMALTELVGNHLINPRPILRRYLPQQFDRIVGTSGIEEESPSSSHDQPDAEKPAP